MSEETKPQLQPPNHAEEKARLECEKLRAEIKAIAKPLVKTPGFYSAFAPVALAILGLIFTWSTGWFDVQRTRVSNEKTLLEAQTERLKTERTTLEAQAREQQVRVTHAEEEIEKLRQRESHLTNQVAKLDRDREELRLAKEFLENETKRLAGSNTKASQFLEQLKSLQATREQLSHDLESLQASNAMLRVTTTRQVALIQWANEVLSEGWSIALKDKATWAKFRNFGDDVRNVHLASMSYLPEWQTLADTRAALDERVRTHDDDLRTETERLREQARNKNYEDYIREAEQRFNFLQHGIRYKTNSNSNSSPPPIPPQSPQSL